MEVLVRSVNERPLVSGEDYSHTSGQTDADIYATLNSLNAIVIKFWKGLNEAVLMVAFHSQRLKDSVGGELWQNVNVTAEEIYLRVCQRSLKPERQSEFALNDYSQLGIPDFPFFDFFSWRGFFAERAVFFFSTVFLASDSEILFSLSCSFLTSSSLS